MQYIRITVYTNILFIGALNKRVVIRRTFTIMYTRMYIL